MTITSTRTIPDTPPEQGTVPIDGLDVADERSEQDFADAEARADAHWRLVFATRRLRSLQIVVVP